MRAPAILAVPACAVAGVALARVVASALGVALAFALAPAPAQAAQTIVGTWATPGRCGRPLSTIVVEPMGLAGEDFYCDFDTVSRTGDEVRWRGTCTFGVDEEKATVTARLSKGRLSYRFNQEGWNGPLARCPD